MPIELESLTSEERSDWQHFLKWYEWYEDNGWVGDEARRLAWVDLQKKHQRLQEFSGRHIISPRKHFPDGGGPGV